MAADRCKLLLQESQAKLEDLRSENSELKAEKSRVAHKADLLDDENGNLRKEIFMLKQLMLEYDRREMQAARVKTAASGSRGLPDHLDFSSHSSLQPDPGPARDDPDRDRVTRFNSACDLRSIYLLNAAKQLQCAQPGPPEPPRFSSPRQPRSIYSPEAGTRSNILTWNNPYEGTPVSPADRDRLDQKRRDKEPQSKEALDPSRAGKLLASPVPQQPTAWLASKKLGSRFSSPQETRPPPPDPSRKQDKPADPAPRPSKETERLHLEKKLLSLSQARDAVSALHQALAEASKLDSKLRSGVATKKKRDLEAAVDSLDKEVAGLKSRLRMLLNNKY